jgi:transposase
MAKGFRPVERDQRFLLPVDMTEWLPADHQVWLVLDVVAQLDLAVLTGRYALAGAGRRAYDPAMMLALLIYGYANGIRSSRAIERACHTDVAFRVICAQDPPDHTQIARFRQRHLDVFTDLFTQVLIVCARAGYVRLGIVAIDGTKVAANASIDANHERDWFAAKVQAMTEEAAGRDAAEDALFGAGRRGDEPPDGMSGRGVAGRAERAARLRQCLQQVVAEQAAQAEQAEAVKLRAADYLAATRAGQPRRGRPPRGLDPVALAQAIAEGHAARYGPEHRYTRRAAKAAAQAEAAAQAQCPTALATGPGRDSTTGQKTGQKAGPQRNSTDPDSRLMPTRKGFIQGYNAQLAGSQDHFIVAADLVQNTGDVAQLQPMLAQSAQTADTLRPHRPDPTAGHANLGTALADNGYCSHANLTADGPDRLIATGKTRDLATAATTGPTSGPPPEHATAVQRMHHRLRTPEGAALYRKRGATIEPINGTLKDRGNLRQFLLRGLHACHAELHLAATAHNLRRLHNLLRNPQPAT